MDDTSTLTQLGSKDTKYYYGGGGVSLLEKFKNQYPNRNYTIFHEGNEFTSLCPKTGQPDFANWNLEYIADEYCVESKSLKLFLGSFRNEGAFMETITNRILEALVELLSPRWMKVTMSFNLRGGIGTSVVAEYVQDEDERNTPKP
jgi:7-cyano-7-deazaguanine reductase